ncbi:MAG: UDP-N-acetylglucosamine 2-epimerase [Candidatus Rokuibacteriota bacterium]
MRRTIGIVTVARSDWGHLLPLLQQIRAAPDLDLLLFVAGAHLAPRFGRTVTFIEAAGWKIDELVDMALESDAPEAIARSIGVGIAGFATALSRSRPSVLVVLGDRFEMLSAAVAALPLMLPIAHVHGGEVTEAVIDEQIRHAITKLAHVHFPAAEPYARRLRQMGEEPWRIHTCGAPGLDRFGATTYLTRDQLAAALGLALRRPTLLVTFHPVTLAPGETEGHVTELLAALDAVDADVVMTSPGVEVDSFEVVEQLKAFATQRSRARFVPSLGDEVYASLLREADAMVGNSSSGLIEAPSFELPVVNIGDRQRGRLRAANVIDVGHGRAEISTGIASALEPAFRRSLTGLRNPYGDGRAAPRIVRVLRDLELGPGLIRKRFMDLESTG